LSCLPRPNRNSSCALSLPLCLDQNVIMDLSSSPDSVSSPPVRNHTSSPDPLCSVFFSIKPPCHSLTGEHQRFFVRLWISQFRCGRFLVWTELCRLPPSPNPTVFFTANPVTASSPPLLRANNVFLCPYPSSFTLIAPYGGQIQL